jgi:hypothetical protein
VVELYQDELLQRVTEKGNLGSGRTRQMEENRHPSPIEERGLGCATDEKEKTNAE